MNIPSKQHARDSTKRLDVVLTVLGISSLIFFLVFYDRAFPSAALDLKLSRREISDRAADYMRHLGYDLSEFQSVLAFREAWMASVYLQRTLGIPHTNALAREKGIPLWFWEMRWFKPLQKEEFGLSLMPDGTIVAMSHTLLEAAPGADIPQEQARSLAEAYVTKDRGWDLRDWEPVSASTVAQPGGRSDHHFEWKRTAWDVGESEMRLAVDVQGDRVDGYGYWLKVPEAFERRFAEQRSRAGFISNLSYYLGVGGFGLVALFYYALGHRRGIFPWNEGAKAGVLVGLVVLLASLNYLPLSKAGYGTTQDYAVFWINELISTVISAAFVAGTIMVLWAGGRYLGRRAWPGQDKLLPRSDDRRITFGRSAWRGLMVGCLGAGYAVLFYLVATQILGGWTPMDVPDVNLYATPLPFLDPLAAGVIPAVNEEFLFRLVGISILLILVGKRWLAVLIPGVVWAFAHLAYVRDPIYLRGVELTLAALLYGVVFLRFDLTTTIVAHLAYNAGLTALPLLRSPQPYFIANGVLVIAGLVALVLPAAVLTVRRRLQGRPATPTLTIRKAMAQDLSGLSSLAFDGGSWSELLADPATTVLCLWAGERVLGVAVGQVQPDGSGQISRLFVAPQWRRRYWGSRLVQALRTELLQQGARGLQATVPSHEWTLTRFWDTQGWEPSEVTYALPAEPSPQEEPSVVMRARRWARNLIHRR